MLHSFTTTAVLLSLLVSLVRGAAQYCVCDTGRIYASVGEEQIITNYDISSTQECASYCTQTPTCNLFAFFGNGCSLYTIDFNQGTLNGIGAPGSGLDVGFGGTCASFGSAVNPEQCYDYSVPVPSTMLNKRRRNDDGRRRRGFAREGVCDMC